MIRFFTPEDDLIELILTHRILKNHSQFENLGKAQQLLDRLANGATAAIESVQTQ